MKYKEGDIVTIQKKLHGHTFNIGEQVTITRVDSNDGYHAQNKEGEHWWVGNAEIIKSNKKTNKMTTNTLYHYGGYALHRRAGTVSFGCGEVKISKARLRALATSLEDKHFVENVKIIKDIQSSVAAMKITTEQLKQFAKLAQNPAFTKGIKALSAVAKATKGRRNEAALLKISPSIFRRIAG